MCLSVSVFGKEVPKQRKETQPQAHTGTSQKKKGTHCQRHPEHPLTPGSTSQATTNSSPSIRRPRGLPQRPKYRKVPPTKRNTTKGSPSIRRPKGYLTNQHTRQSPRTQKQRSQQWSEYPQSSGSTSHTDIQTVPQKHKRNSTKRSPSIRRPQGLPHNPTYKTVPPNTKTKKPAVVARVSAEFGVYLTHRHTDGPPKTQQKHYQGQPEYPQTPGSTSNTNMQERRETKQIRVYRQVPQQKKEPIPKGSPNIRRPRSLPQRPTYRKVQKKAKERCRKRKQEPTKAGQSIHRPRGLPQRPTYRTVTPRGRRHRAAALKLLVPTCANFWAPQLRLSGHRSQIARSRFGQFDGGGRIFFAEHRGIGLLCSVYF